MREKHSEDSLLLSSRFYHSKFGRDPLKKFENRLIRRGSLFIHSDAQTTRPRSIWSALCLCVRAYARSAKSMNLRERARDDSEMKKEQLDRTRGSGGFRAALFPKRSNRRAEEE